MLAQQIHIVSHHGQQLALEHWLAAQQSLSQRVLFGRFAVFVQLVAVDLGAVLAVALAYRVHSRCGFN